jgi:hypothetical protein
MPMSNGILGLRILHRPGWRAASLADRVVRWLMPQGLDGAHSDDVLEEVPASCDPDWQWLETLRCYHPFERG